jgi:hypothetical protein
VSRRSAQQLLLVALSLAVWSAVGRPSLLALLLSYIGVLAVWQIPLLRSGLEPLRPRQLVLFALLLSTPALCWAYRVRSRIAERENLAGLSARLVDRWRLEDTPSIAPPLLSADRPQTFFVHAPGAARVRVQLGEKARVLAAEALGSGLFRLDYDPRRDAAPDPAEGTLRARILTDDRSVEREMRVVTPLVRPRWFCVSPNATWAATPSEETDELIVFGPGQRVSSLAVGDGPVDCVFPDDATLIVSHGFEPTVSAYDVASGRRIRTRSLPGRLGRIALSPDASRLVVARVDAQPELLVLSWPAFELEQRLSLPAAADWLAFATDADRLVATTRADASIRQFTRVAGLYAETALQRLGRPAVSMGRSRDGTRVWIATTDYRPDGRPQLGNHFVQDQLLTVSVADLRVLERRLTARRSERQSKPGDIDQGGSPMGIHELRDGSLAVTFAGTDELWRIRPGAADPELLDLSETELNAPHGIAELADGTLLISSPSSGALGVLAPGASRPSVLRLAPSAAALRAKNPAAFERRMGERGFYESTRSGIACQSCHIHATADAAGYNLGNHRAIPTLSVQGLLGTAPYLRDGSYPRIRDLDEVAQTLYRGYLRHQPRRSQLLEVFLEGLPRVQPLPVAARDRVAERRGLQAFDKAHCGRCHAFPAFTNLGLVTLSTLFPKQAALLPSAEMLDVPSLLSIGQTAPYLNDGRAATLAAVIGEQNTANLHGAVRALSSAERRDLITFLGSL